MIVVSNVARTKPTCLFGLIIFSLFFCVVTAQAMVTGDCSNCHSMHNSQDGKAVTEGTSEPYQSLTVDSCVGCHSDSSNNTIKSLGGNSRVPIVFNGNEPTYPPDGSSSSTLAGGNFYWVAQGDDSKGHNVYGISDADATLKFAPGRSTQCSPCHDTLATADSGCQGCHLPAHHADDSGVVVDAAGGSYRFLGDLMSRVFYYPDSGNGVKGIEDADWEQSPSSTRHNTYAGTSSSYSMEFGNFLDTSSIGQFCSGCHGNFHHLMNSEPGSLDGAWIRHPSDVVLPDDPDGEYKYYTNYNPLTPVGKPDLDAGMKNSPVVVPGTDVVTCISCHRPHGSPYPDMLRWDYENCEVGVSNSECGCFVCHTQKDD